MKFLNYSYLLLQALLEEEEKYDKKKIELLFSHVMLLSALPFAAERKTIVAKQFLCAAPSQALKSRLTDAIYCKMLAIRGLDVRHPKH